MEKRKIKTRVLAFVSTFIIIISLCATIAFAQAYDGSFDFLDSPTVIVTAYPTEENQYNFNKPLFQYIANGWEYLPPQYINSSANGFSVVFYRDFYETYTLDDILTTQFTYSIILLNRTSTTMGSFDNYEYYGTLQNAIDKFIFPTADIVFEQLENAYYEQFTYWENQFENEYNHGYEEGRSYGYTQALTDVEALENAFVTIFNAPFDFLTNISEVQLFGISIFDIVGVILVLALGYLLLRFIGGAIPL